MDFTSMFFSINTFLLGFAAASIAHAIYDNSKKTAQRKKLDEKFDSKVTEMIEDHKRKVIEAIRSDLRGRP
jgi:hypothetical protein